MSSVATCVTLNSGRKFRLLARVLRLLRVCNTASLLKSRLNVVQPITGLFCDKAPSDLLVTASKRYARLT